MSTFLQMLRLAFWLNPLQRVLACIGVALVVVEVMYTLFHGLAFLSSSASTRGLHVSAASLLMGGVYWRIVSAPRIVRLAPHGRARLLAGVLGVVLVVALLLSLMEWLPYLRWKGQYHPRYAPSFAQHLAVIGESMLTASVVIISFIASRSPLAALVVLIVLAAPGGALTLFDIQLSRYASRGTVAFTLLALIWIPLAIWYLNARRINFPRWLAGSGNGVLATTLVSSGRPRSRAEALQRQLLGGTTILRFGLQWFVVLGLLLGLQWVFARVGEWGDPQLVARVMYASLCICPIVTTIVSFAAVRRSRALWLLATSSRTEFFSCVDLMLMRLNVAMVAVHAVWLVAVWFTYARQPGPLLEQLKFTQLNWLALWAPGFLAINAQLARLPKWPMAMLAAGVLVAGWQLAGAGARGVVATMVLLFGAIIVAFALRSLARRRWRSGDFPRAVTSTASGT